jgi:hypothetical protein
VPVDGDDVDRVGDALELDPARLGYREPKRSAADRARHGEDLTAVRKRRDPRCLVDAFP